MAFVVRRDQQLTADDVVAMCRSQIAGYKVPKDVIFVADEELPRSTSGKIKRYELEDELGAADTVDPGLRRADARFLSRRASAALRHKSRVVGARGRRGGAPRRHHLRRELRDPEPVRVGLCRLAAGRGFQAPWKTARSAATQGGPFHSRSMLWESQRSTSPSNTKPYPAPSRAMVPPVGLGKCVGKTSRPLSACFLKNSTRVRRA